MEEKIIVKIEETIQNMFKNYFSGKLANVSIVDGELQVQTYDDIYFDKKELTLISSTQYVTRNEGFNLTTTLLNSEGVGASGETVTLTGSDGSSYTVTTNENGVASKTINSINSDVIYTASYKDLIATCNVELVLFYDACDSDININHYVESSISQTNSTPAHALITYDSTENAYQLIGQSPYFVMEEIPELNGLDNYVISADMKLTSTSAFNQIGFGIHEEGNQNNTYMYRIRGDSKVQTLIEGMSQESTISYLYTNDIWFNMKVTKQGNNFNLELFRDGNTVGTYNWTIPAFTNARCGFIKQTEQSSPSYIKNIVVEALDGLSLKSSSEYVVENEEFTLTTRLSGNDIANKTISLTGSDGSSYTITTDNNGVASKSISNISSDVIYTTTYEDLTSSTTVYYAIFKDNMTRENHKRIIEYEVVNEVFNNYNSTGWTLSNRGEGNIAFIRPLMNNTCLFFNWDNDYRIHFKIHSTTDNDSCKVEVYKDAEMSDHIDLNLHNILGVTTITSPIDVVITLIDTTLTLYVDGVQKISDTKDWKGSIGFLQLTNNLSSNTISDLSICEYVVE